MELQLPVERVMFLAQDTEGGGLLLAMVFFFVMVYAYFAVSLSTIARKTGTEGGWMAWIPILNTFLMLKCADRPGWWFILLLIPGINYIILLLLYIDIANRRGKSTLLGVLVWLFPVLIGLLAAGD